LRKTPSFSAENWQTSQKIVFITSTPGKNCTQDIRYEISQLGDSRMKLSPPEYIVGEFNFIRFSPLSSTSWRWRVWVSDESRHRIIVDRAQGDQIGRIFAQWEIVHFGQFLKHCRATFPLGADYVLILTKTGFGYILGDFLYINSSGHPDPAFKCKRSFSLRFVPFDPSSYILPIFPMLQIRRPNFFESKRRHSVLVCRC
jgi:hypothetical protein